MTEIPESEILTCNRLSMDWLRKGNLIKSEEYLQKAQSLLKTRAKSKQTSHLWAITLNNLACVSKRKGDLDKALSLLKIAQAREERSLNDVLNLAGIHLNTSAILSQLNSHDVSLKHAMAAIKILAAKGDKDKSEWVSLVISYQSAGYEQECLQNYNAALDLYLKGWENAQDHLGAFHKITENVKKNYLTLNKSGKVQKNAFVGRSRTPSLLPKSSYLSIGDKSGHRNSKRKFNSRFESIKNLESIDLLISEIEFGKSESSTEVHSGRPEKMMKVVKGSRKVLKFEKLPKMSQGFGVEKAQDADFELEVKVEEKFQEKQELKIETDDEYSLEFMSESIGEPEIPTVRSPTFSAEHLDNWESDSKALNIKELSVKCKNKETQSERCESGERKSFMEKEIQTNFCEHKEKSSQTYIKPSPFRRIAAILIQQHWRAYKRSKDPKYFEYLKEIQNARLEADQALDKLNQIKLKHKSSPKRRLNDPVPKRSKILL